MREIYFVSVLSVLIAIPCVPPLLTVALHGLRRNKSGIWGWRTDKTEVVNGFDAKVRDRFVEGRILHPL